MAIPKIIHVTSVKDARNYLGWVTSNGIEQGITENFDVKCLIVEEEWYLAADQKELVYQNDEDLILYIKSFSKPVTEKQLKTWFEKIQNSDRSEETLLKFGFEQS